MGEAVRRGGRRKEEAATMTVITRNPRLRRGKRATVRLRGATQHQLNCRRSWLTLWAETKCHVTRSSRECGPTSRITSYKIRRKTIKGYSNQEVPWLRNDQVLEGSHECRRRK